MRFDFGLFRRKPPPTPVAVVTPDSDDDHDAPDGSADAVAEGQSFMIVYEAANGRQSTRRITVWAIRNSPGNPPSLYAKCLERNAMRSFRVDRIIEVIDYDGEIHEPGLFLQENLGLDPRVLRSPAGGKLSAMRAQCRPHIMLLAALSRCDGYMHPAERSVALSYCEALCNDLEPSLEDCAELENIFRRIRPDDGQIDEALDEIYSADKEAKVRFVQTAQQLILADGKLKPEEVEMFDEFCVALLGHRLASQ